jgi:hypothetical protein
MHAFRDTQFWEKENMTVAVAAHVDRLHRIQNCSGNDDSIARPFLAMLGRQEWEKFPWMREKACNDLAGEIRISSESDMSKQPLVVSELYKAYNCYFFYLENKFKANIEDRREEELEGRKVKNQRYIDVKRNISFFQLLDKCPDGSVGLGEHCRCDETDPCAFSTLRTFLPSPEAVKDYLRRGTYPIFVTTFYTTPTSISVCSLALLRADRPGILEKFFGLSAR